ncbi:MAG: HDIG domain-containing metalloprotein [Cyanobacteria bacterium P01_F01_bin.150]
MMKLFRSLAQQIGRGRQSDVVTNMTSLSSGMVSKNIEESQSKMSAHADDHQPATVSIDMHSVTEKGTGKTSAKTTDAIARFLQTQADEFKSPSNTTSLNCSPKKKARKRLGYSSSIAFVVTVASLTSAIGYRFYNEPKLAVETIAPQTLRAPEDALVEDVVTTQARREAASKGALPVLMIDQTVNQRIYQSLQRSLTYAGEIRTEAGAFPFIDPSTLSTRAQNYLRQASESEWRDVLVLLDAKETKEPGLLNDSGVLREETPSANGREEELSTFSPQASQQLAIIELQAYRNASSKDDFSALKQLIIRSRQRYKIALATLNSSPVKKPTNFYTHSLLLLTDNEWVETQSGIRHILERTLTQGVSAGTPDDLLRQAILFHIERYVPQSAIPLTVDLLMGIIKPNLVRDEEQTRVLAEQAAQSVQPEMVEIRRGETIVEAGDQISQAQFVLLDEFQMSGRGINWFGLVGFAALTSGGVALFLFAEYRFRPKLRSRDHVLVVLLILSTPLVIALGLPASNLPLVGLLIGSFYGSPLGITVISLLSLMLPIGLEINVRTFIASVVGSLVGTVMADRLRSREELALLGGSVGLVQGIVFLIISLILSAAAGPVFQTLLTATLIQALMGVAWSVVALGISPYLEHLFDLVTPIRLVELSNPNRPLLKRLASEAPGTFQHTVFVASLAEAAARDLRCNVELVRSGTLYHDIGKMHDPQGFIENQMGGPNKHDLINDPWKSAEIIKKHVSEGLVMARKCRLPGAIQACIPEHQGTMLITYFYYQAKKRAEEDPSIEVREEDFRYDGPIPQSRETGILMLADSCEAALRSLKDASYEEALAMVNKILNARWQDNQMVDSGLTRQDMRRIAEIFVRVWQQYNHKRIPYPKAALNPTPSPVSS